MTADELDELDRLASEATPGPWFVQERSDNWCMSSVVVTNRPNPTPEYGANLHEWTEDDVVAACLLQDGSYVQLADQRWRPNAELISAMRNSMADLIRLARIGLAAQGCQPAN